MLAFPDLDGLDQEARHLLLRTEGALAGYLRMIPRRCGSAESLLPLHCGAAGSDEG
jgi:predicted GNAT family N-acyltransferase